MASRVPHNLLDTKSHQLLVYSPAVYSIAITNQVTRGIPIGKRLKQLLSDPAAVRCLGR